MYFAKITWDWFEFVTGTRDANYTWKKAQKGALDSNYKGTNAHKASVIQYVYKIPKMTICSQLKGLK